MSFFGILINILETEDFSVKMIDDCKDIFQYRGLEKYEIAAFKKLFYRKAKKSCPALTDEQIEQIFTIIYWAGVLRIEDILFIDGTAFTSYEGFSINWETSAPKKEYKPAYAMEFYGDSEKYKNMNFLETTHFFYYHLYVSKKLNENIIPILPQLRDEINDIFVNYYNNNDFPEKLAMSSAKGYSYAISYDVNEILNGLNNRTPFDISIICRVENKCEVIKLDINCNLSNEKFLTVTNVAENAERLSTIIEQNNKAKSNEKGIRLIRM